MRGDFDKEELYESPEDREALLRMPETRREEILYQRHLQLKKFKEKKELEEKVSRLERSERVEAVESVSDFAEFSQCIVGRDLLANNVFKPFFEDFVGHYTRARINGLYLVAKIVKVSRGPVYGVAVNRKEARMNRYLSVSTGTRVYDNFRIENISNSPLLEEEYEDVWRSFNIGPLSKVRERYARLVRMMGRELSDEEVTRMIACRDEVYPKKRSVTQMKIDLIQRRDRAIEAKNQKTAMECQQRLEEIEDNEERW